jgi:hypothetical protein
VEDFWDLLQGGMGWGFAPGTNRVYGFDYAVSPSVTDQMLKKQLGQKAELENCINSSSWEHEFRHATVGKYVFTIFEPFYSGSPNY